MSYYITPEFEALIGASRLESLNSHPGSVYGLDSALNISYLNPAWFKFSEDNGGEVFVSSDWTLGKQIFSSIPDAQKSFYRDLFESALNENKPSITSQQMEYECSSPELYRRFSMHLYPVGKDGILVVHSLLIEEPHRSSLADGVIVLDEDNYIDKDGIVRQCANCRRIQNLNNTEQWDWIPKWVTEAHPRTSHSICRPCRQHYYSGIPLR
jgi:hypothetical protein